MPKNNEKASPKEAGEEGGEGSQEEGVLVGDGNKEPSEKEKLLALYQQLKDLGINSIGDLEVKISRL